MRGLKRGIAAATTAALCLTSVPLSGLQPVFAAGTDKVVKLQPGLASTFNDTNGDGLGEFEGWGTSLCWWANRIGYSSALTEDAARVFFSDEGLDMNIGRYNVGGGDLVGDPTEVPVNEKALFYDLETDGRKPEYSGKKMDVGTNTAMKSVKYSASDADFGITKGSEVGSFKAIGWINKLGDQPGDGDNLRYTVNVSEAGSYTVKILLTLTGNNKRDVAIKVNDSDEFVVDAGTVNSGMIASGNNNMLFVVTIPNVALQAGDNTINIAGKNDWTLDFVKMAVIKSGEEGTLPEGEEFLHSPHIARSDSAIPGYATDVTKINTDQHELAWYEENYDRADESCGYAWNYDWDADKNQINILEAAAKASGKDFIAEAFSNSPPYFMTNSGCSSGAVDSSKDNLRADSYRAFAVYMADVIEHWNKESVITFQSATPMNEPYTSYWGAYSNKQEGCHFDQGESQSKIIEMLNEELKKREINIIICGTDETSIDTAISSYNALSDEAKGIIQRIDTHTYGGSRRAELKELAEKENKNLWMSEVDGAYTAGTDAGEMSAALGLAKQMMTDVNGLKANAWILWNAIDMHVDKEIKTSSDADYASLEKLYNRVNMNSGYWGIAIGDHDNQEILLTKKYYAYGQLSRYIRPGYTIIGSSDDTLAAYDPESGKVVIVAVNTAGEDKTWKFDLSSFSTMGDNVTAIRTSGTLKDGENWADVSSEDTIAADTAKKSITAVLKANSITTYIVDGVTYDSSTEEIVRIDDVNVYTVEDVAAELPDTVEVVTNKNNTLEKKVTWDLEGVDLTKDTKVTGTVEGTTMTATADVQVVAPNMIYFIDCNSPESPKYAAMDQYADLLNEKADQAYTEGSWGYLDAYGQYNGTVTDEYDTGWYANKDQVIKYTIPLDAGNYKVSFGFKEWWKDGNKSRSMNITAEHDGQTDELGITNTWNGNNWWNTYSQDMTIENAGDVTFCVAKQENNDPVLSFIKIQKILDLSELQDAITAAGEVDRAQYPAAKLAVLDAAVAAGRDLMLKSATTQDQIKEGAAAIQDAITGLGEGYTEEQIAANDYVLYLVNCGTTDASVVPDGYRRGLYQSNVDQEYSADAETGLSWGYEPNDENSKIVKGGSGAADITSTYIYMADTGVTFIKDVSGFKYKFEVPQRANNDYIVTAGFKNPWDTRNVDIKLEGETVESDLKLTKGQLVEKSYKVEVHDGELNVMVHSPKRTNQYGDPVLSYLMVEAVAAYTVEGLEAKINSYEASMDGHSYSDTTKKDFDLAVTEARKLIEEQSTDQKAIKNALNALEEAYNALKEVFTYSSITGTNGAQLFDNNGNKIQAHGGQIQQFTIDGETKYYWYGEDKTNGYRPVVGVHLYTSTDLYNWTDEGAVLKSIPVSEEDYGKDQEEGYEADLSIFETDEYFSSLYGDYKDQAPDDTENYSSKLEEVYWNLAEDRTVIERPKVLYNDATGKYVMWFHADGRTPTNTADYGKARAGVAISDSPTGPFKLLGTYKLHDSADANHSWDNVGGAVRDMNLFKDDDGQAYVIYSSDGNLTTYIAKLNADYTGLIADPADAVEGTGKEGEELTASDYTRNFIDASREAPAMFKYKDKYYIINSGCTGWSPNKAQYAVADHPLGPWTVMGDPCVGDTKGTTFDTQSTCVFPVDAANGKFIYMGDRWFNPDSGGDLSDSRYVWLPVEFLPGNQIQLKNYADWTLDELENKASFEVTSELPTVVSSVSEIADVLPGTVMADFGSGSVEKEVTWDIGSLDENKLGVAAVTGILTDGNREFTHEISIVNPKLIYFFDSGADTSEYYDTVSANLLGRLKNTVPDEAYTEENGAGYVGVTNLVDKDKFDLGHHAGDTYLSNGWWAASGKDIVYAFNLEPGIYTVSAGFQEWWNTGRPSKMTITSGDDLLAEKAFTVYNTSTDLQVNQTFEVTEETKEKVTVTISKTGNPDPVISWIGVTHDDAAVNKDKLNTLITAVDALKKDNYSEETWEALSIILEEARAAFGSEEADQKAIDEVTKALAKAIEDLESTANKEALQSLADEVNAMDNSIYTSASWTEYQSVVETAKAEAQGVLDNKAALQDEIDAARKVLLAAFNAGKEKLVTIQSVLEKGIAANTVPESSKESYTEESWADYAAALEAAQALMESNDEDAVNEALAALEAARLALVQKPEHDVDKTALIQAIENAPSEEEAGLYTAKSWTPYAEALAKAVDTRDSESALQLDVDTALAALTVAQDELVTLEEKLAAVIAEYELGISAPESYTEESWTTYENALAAAKALQGKEGLTETEIDAAEQVLADAYDGLTPVEVATVDKDALQAVIEQAEQLKKEDYTEEAWTAFEEALNKAKAVYDNKDASQKEVNKEVTALAEAMAELKKHPVKTEEETDKSALKAIIDKASQLKKDDYTGTTWAKFQKAFDDAANIYESETATQEQIDAAAASLQAAMDQLEKITAGPNPKPQPPTDNNKDKGKNPSSPSGSGSQKGTSSAKTGDETPIAMFAGFGAIALIAIFVCTLSILRRRKRS